MSALTKKLFTVILSFIVLGTTLITYAPKGHAQLCSIDSKQWEYKTNLFEIDLTTTLDAFVTSLLTSTLSKIAFNNELDQTAACIKYFNDQEQFLPETIDTSDCEPRADYCEAIGNTYKDPTVTNSTGMLQKMRESGAGGSLLGLATMMDHATKEPLPVNLAFFMNKQAQKIPYVGEKAYAQSLSYRGPFLDLTYQIWTIFRNMAFGLMAIMMIIVGIMIITRKRVDAQTMVTVQYAIPKIVIALVLIAFSYPIGAILSSFAWALSFSFDNIIQSAAFSTNANLADAFTMLRVGGPIAALLMGLVTIPITGGFSAIPLGAIIVMMIATLILKLLTSFKVLTIYIKMLVKIVTAPLRFTYGAIPGNEAQTTGWFQEMGVHILGIFGMSAAIGVTQIVGAAIAVELAASAGSTSSLGLAASSLVTSFVNYIVLIYGYNEARKIPDKLEAALLGTGGGGGGKRR